MANSIPIVDVSSCSVEIEDWDPSKCVTEAQQITEAFKNIGFVYLVNTGITQAQVDQLNLVTKTFFHLPVDVKSKYRRPGNDANQGWEALELETLNPQRPADLKESYNVTPPHKQIWPDEELPEFRREMSHFLHLCQTLSYRVLSLMGIGLGLDKDIFAKEHIPWGTNISSLRCLYYPELPSQTGSRDRLTLLNAQTTISYIKKDQVRCGEHTDYGSITLLFQDQVPGLQVFTRGKEWVSARPIPGSVLVNVADLMQRWTADVLVSTPHRVLLPESEELRKQARQSIAFFGHPNDDSMIEPVDGSKKYPPINSIDYIMERFAATY